MPTSINIRPILPQDIPAIATLARTVWLSAYADILSMAQIDFMLEERYAATALEADIKNPEKWLYQAWVDGSLAGFAASEVYRGEFKLDKLYIDPQKQRRGIGQALVEHASALGLEHGFPRLILAVNKNNTQAIRAYEKYGFGVRDKTVTAIGGGFVMDDYIMEKSLIRPMQQLS